MSIFDMYWRKNQYNGLSELLVRGGIYAPWDTDKMLKPQLEQAMAICGITTDVQEIIRILRMTLDAIESFGSEERWSKLAAIIQKLICEYISSEK